MFICRAIDWSSHTSLSGTFLEDVYFVVPALRRLWPELSPPDGWMNIPAVDPWRLTSLESIWVVSTYLRLKAKGWNVKISDRVVPDAINVCASDDVIYVPDSHRAFILAIQADRGPLGWGDYTLVQSPLQARRARTCLIDHWPQPGLLSRDPARGDHIRRVGYLGYSENLAPSFRGERFRTELAALGVEWVLKEKPTEWHDYSDLDLCLGVRGTSQVWVRNKPATKLFHSWMTGSPALLGNEPAYRYWGDPGRDYLEVSDLASVLNAVRRLQRDTTTYRDLRERGRAKAADHDEAAVMRQWIGVLSGPAWQAFSQWRSARPSRILVRATARHLAQVTVPARRRIFFLRAGGVRRRVDKLWRLIRAYVVR